MRTVKQESNTHKQDPRNGGKASRRGTKLNTHSLLHKIDPNDINVQKINTDCNYKLPDLCKIPKGTRIPSLSTTMFRQFLR